MKDANIYLVPSPLALEAPFDEKVIYYINDILQKNNDILVLVESEKIARGRWIKSGLDRKLIDFFIPFNEHTEILKTSEIIQKCKLGAKVFIIVDEGIPCVHDPGTHIISSAWKENLLVTSMPFSNSWLQALALSGFYADKFIHFGFPAARGDERKKDHEDFLRSSKTSILMDTAYRLESTLDQLGKLEKELLIKSQLFLLAMDLNRESELLLRGKLGSLLEAAKGKKQDFILIKQSK